MITPLKTQSLFSRASSTFNFCQVPTSQQIDKGCNVQCWVLPRNIYHSGGLVCFVRTIMLCVWLDWPGNYVFWPIIHTNQHRHTQNSLDIVPQCDADNSISAVLLILHTYYNRYCNSQQITMIYTLIWAVNTNTWLQRGPSWNVSTHITISCETSC